MTTISRKLIRREPAGYKVWQEISLAKFKAVVFDGPGDPTEAQEITDAINDASGRLVTREIALTFDGHYIGNLDRARFLCDKRGIIPELSSPDHNVCSIGFCERKQKWYGWSHRAIYGFGVGDVAEKGDSCTTSGWTDEYLKDHPDDLPVPVGFEAKTLADAKRMAIAFAASVS